MKQFNSNIEQRNMWPKSMAILALSITLQGRACVNSKGGVITYTAHNTDIKAFEHELRDRNDISRQIDGIDFLHAAVMSGNVKKVEAVLSCISENKGKAIHYVNSSFPNSIDKNDSNTALLKAIEMGNEIIVEKLINHESLNPSLVIQNPKTKVTPLHLAIRRKLYKAANNLVSKLEGADLTEKDNDGKTPLHLAIEYGPDSLVTSLVAKLNITSLIAIDKKNRTPLHIAARCNKQGAFNHIWDRLFNELTPISYLLAKNKNSNSVFACAYLPKNRIVGKVVNISSANDKMFNHILGQIKSKLTVDHYDTILSEIDQLTVSHKIDAKHNVILRNIVKNSRGV